MILNYLLQLNVAEGFLSYIIIYILSEYYVHSLIFLTCYWYFVGSANDLMIHFHQH